MNTSGKRSGGYGRKGRQPKKTAAEPWLRKTKDNAEEAKWLEAREAMLAAIRELLEAQRCAHAAKTGLDRYAAAMRRLLRHVRRKVKETAGNIEVEQPSRRRKSPSASRSDRKGRHA